MSHISGAGARLTLARPAPPSPPGLPTLYQTPEARPGLTSGHSRLAEDERDVGCVRCQEDKRQHLT